MLFAWRIVFGGLEGSQVGQESRADELVVDELRSVEPAGQEAPDEDDGLEQPVEGDQGQDKIREEFNEAEASKNHPVGQPDGIVLLVPTLDGQYGCVGGVCESDSVADQLGAVSYDDHGTEEEGRTQYNLPPLDARGSLNLDEVFIELVFLLELLVQH